ncbi:MAG: FkbM family methyltransferase [Candidatus Aminicenantaceae bacterium]
MVRNNKLSSLLWHPHQGLWNWALLGAIRKIVPLSPIYIPIFTLIAYLDSAILFLRALLRRVSQVGFTKIFSKVRIPDDASILYLDLGTHKEGNELALMVERILPRLCKKFESYGFEASRESFDQVKAKFANKKNVDLINKALCYVLPPEGKIKLFKDIKREGVGDSLYKPTEHYEKIEAMRLSDWLRESNIDLQNRICLLRMNIEGSEYDVIKDLVERGLAKHIDGYYGMWDDVSKIDKKRGEEFLAYLEENKIYNFTFNIRDMEWPVRIRCIEYDIGTSVQAGLNRIKRRVEGKRK